MPAQYRAIWSTAGGGTGYSVFNAATAASSADAQNMATSIRAFFQANVALFPNEVQINFDDEVRVLDLAGALVRVYPVAAPATVTGTDPNSYNRAAGIRIDWNTGEIVAGRRLNGRTFLVPAAPGAFTTDGLVNSATMSAVGASGVTLDTALTANGGLVVWSRTHAVQAAVTGVTVPAKGAILRGRRD